MIAMMLAVVPSGLCWSFGKIPGTNVEQEIVSGFRLTVQDVEGESF